MFLYSGEHIPTPITLIQKLSSTIPKVSCKNWKLSIISLESFNEFLDINELYSISQGRTTIYKSYGIEVSASQIPSTADKITTYASRGLKSKKSKRELALESQEWFGYTEKASKKAQKEAANLKK